MDRRLNYNMLRTRTLLKKKIIGISPEEATNGIYIYHNNGKLYKSEEWHKEWNNNAVGVAVITSDCRFVIDKANDSPNKLLWGNGRTFIEGATYSPDVIDSYYDYEGKTNTDAIVSTFSNSRYATKYCRLCNYYINSTKIEGYLGAAGEWKKAIDNRVTIDKIISLIDGEPLHFSEENWITEYSYHTSTQGDMKYKNVYAANYSGANFGSSAYPIGSTSQTNEHYVRPFYELN